jgi:hypothetical protein
MMKKGFELWIYTFLIVGALAFCFGAIFTKYLGGYPTPTPLRSGLLVVVLVGLPLSILATLIYLAIRCIYSYITKN